MKLNFSGMWIRSTIGALLLAGPVILTACGGGGGGGGGDNNNEPPASTTPPTAFILSAPTNTATGVIFAPTLSWTDASGETSYTVQISTSETFTPLTYETTTIPANTTSSAVPSGILNAGTKYYWQVIAVNSAGQTTAANAPFTFTTTASFLPPTTFDLSSPADNATDVVLTPTFTWTGASGVDSYTLQISILNDFASPLYNNSAIAANATGFSLPSGILGVGTQYYWRVIAVNSVGQTAASNASLTFTTLKSGGLAWSQTSNPSDFPDEAYSVALDSNSLYVVGYDSNTSPQFDDEWRIEKRNLSDGSFVTLFGSGGVVTENPSSLDFWSFDDAYAVAIDSAYMYVVGYDSFSRGTDTNSTDERWRIEKRGLSDGGLDNSFGTDGIVTSDTSTYDPNALFDTGMDEAYAIAIDSAYMYVVGYETSTLGDKEWRIEKRNLSDGALVWATVSDPSAGDDVANAIAIDSAYMYVVGYDTTATQGREWRIEKRNLSYGALVWAVVSDPSTGDDVANAIAIDSTYMYVAGYEASGSFSRWRIEKRMLSDGSLDTVSFGLGHPGFVTSGDPSNGYNDANAIVIDAAYMYVAGYDTTASHNLEWRIEKRNLSDGSLVPSFGTNGVVTPNPASTLDSDAWAIIADTDYIYVAGYDSQSTGDSQWRIEKRAK